MGHKARIVLLLASVIALCSLLCYVAFHQFYVRGLEAEAKLMISHAHTLERVYRLENKRFVFWDELYGAPLKGEDNCSQPESAAELGFLIPGCHREGAQFPRYAYRIVSEAVGERYRIEASSGSDKAARSFVCFDPSGQELWQSSQNLEFTQIVSCW